MVNSVTNILITIKTNAFCFHTIVFCVQVDVSTF